MALNIARHVHVTGRVQGVGFRWHTRAEARALDVTGWVKNLADGRVEAWLEGRAEAVEALVAWLQRGPSGAFIEDVSVVDATPRHPGVFEILR
jgi:acylphosphatase